MKRSSHSGVSQAAIRRNKRKAIRNVYMLNFAEFEDGEGVDKGFNSDHVDNNSEDIVSNNSVVEIESVCDDVDSDNFIVGHSDSELSDDFIDFNDADGPLLFIEQQPQQTFKEKLASWGVDCRVPHVHVNKLLSILKSHPCHADLPVDARTLLKTPRKVSLIPMHPGEYFHFDFLNALKDVINKKFLLTNHLSIEIEILINVDGLPMAASLPAKY